MRPAQLGREVNSGPFVTGPPRFDTVYEEYFKFVWRSLRRLGVPLESLDDAVQEVFLAVYRRLPDFEGRSSLKVWLFGIVLNVSQHAVRSAARRRANTLPAPKTVDEATPQDALLRAEAVKRLYCVLDRLSPERRSTFVMAELEQMSAAEIAEVSGVPLNTVYSRLRLARRDVAAVLKRLEARESGNVS